MTHRVGPKGQVVIPKAIRDRLGIKPGDTVDFEEAGGDVRIRRADPLPLLGLLADAGPDPLTRALEDEHRDELARENARAR